MFFSTKMFTICGGRMFVSLLQRSSNDIREMLSVAPYRFHHLRVHEGHVLTQGRHGFMVRSSSGARQI